MAESKEYRIWTNCKTRCYNPANDAYPRYGGRGIVMCDEWVNDFARFYADMGDCPQGLTLDRIDTNGQYSKDNCRWASYAEQNNNRRDNKRLTINGETRTYAEWEKIVGLNPGMVSVRLRAGMCPFDAVFRPVRKKKVSEGGGWEVIREFNA